jgi:hypothetical protein
MPVMNGLPQNMLPSPWNITVFLFHLFSPLTAYLINDFLVRVIGFIGMILLLKNIIFTKNNTCSNIVAFSCAIIYSFIGSYTILGLSTFGQPLILFVFCNLYKNQIKWWYYILIILFALYSSFAFCGIFICISLTVWWLYELIRHKKIHIAFLGGMAILSVSYIVVEHQAILEIFNPVSISHRTEFLITSLPATKQYITDFMCTQYHSGKFCTIPIICIVGFSSIYSKKIDRLSLLLLLIAIVIFLVKPIYHFTCLKFGASVSLLRMFQWDRFYFLLPLIWFLLLSLSLKNVIESRSIRNLSIYLSLFIMFVNVLYFNKEFKNNMAILAGINISQPTYRNFFDTTLFERIKRYIGKEQSAYRIVSLGLSPSIGTYNGYFSLDHYPNMYPLSYKHQFRKIIAGELEKSADLKNYFDHWGCRCYLFSDELKYNYLWSKEQNKKVCHLNIDTKELKQLSQKETYIFSAVEIMNYESLGIKLLEFFEGNYWKIYLYQVY